MELVEICAAEEGSLLNLQEESYKIGDTALPFSCWKLVVYIQDKKVVLQEHSKSTASLLWPFWVALKQIQLPIFYLVIYKSVIQNPYW